MNGNGRGKLAVVAVGGNALIREKGKESHADQLDAVNETMRHVVAMIRAGWNVVVTHGNGPQVGYMLRQSELAAGEVCTIPLDYCGANTQGSIGYMFQTALDNQFRQSGMANQAVTLVTHTLVNRNDPAFQRPTKPIGSFMDEATARKRQEEDGWSIVEDAGRGWRRVVPSPAPVRVLQHEVIRSLAAAGYTVVCAGGGGIPVVENEEGHVEGVEAVIDKDLASALLAASIDADLFLISTEVERVALNFNTPDVRWLDHLTVDEARQYTMEGQFGKGSMEPKIGAVIQFLERGGGRAIITNPENMLRALAGETGTQFENIPVMQLVS